MSVWRNREGQNTDQKFKELEETLGVENLKDVSIDEENAYLFITTETKKFRIQMVEV